VQKNSALAKLISGRPIRFAENSLGFVSWTLNLTGADPNVESVSTPNEPGVAEIHNTVPMGLADRFLNGQSREGQPIETKGEWLDDDTFSVVIKFINDGSTRTFTFKFHGDSVAIQFRNAAGSMTAIQGSLAR
jgi:hypothetical protein